MVTYLHDDSSKHQQMSEDAVENTNKDQQISVDTNESTEAAGQEVVRQEMVEPPTADSDESEVDDPEVVPQSEVYQRTEGNSPPKAEAAEAKRYLSFIFYLVCRQKYSQSLQICRH